MILIHTLVLIVINPRCDLTVIGGPIQQFRGGATIHLNHLISPPGREFIQGDGDGDQQSPKVCLVSVSPVNKTASDNSITGLGQLPVIALSALEQVASQIRTSTGHLLYQPRSLLPGSTYVEKDMVVGKSVSRPPLYSM